MLELFTRGIKENPMLDKFSWILPDKLAVGPFPKSDSSITYLSRMGITAVLCLTEKFEVGIPEEIYNRFVWERVAMPDGARGGIPTPEDFESAIAVLERWQRKGHVVYLHCLAGIGRSPAICAAYLVKSQGLEIDEAILYIKERRPIANPDVHQVRVMREFFARQGLRA